MFGGALAMEWVSRVILLEAVICVDGNLSTYQGIGVAFTQPVIILHVSFRATPIGSVCLERPHEEQAYSAVEKQSANAVVRTVAG